MNYSIETNPLETLKSDLLIVGIYSNQQLSFAAKTLDVVTNGLLTSVVKRGDIAGKLNDTLLLNVVPNSNIERILLVGLGEQKPLSAKNYRKILTATINALKKLKVNSVAISLTDCDVEKVDLTWKTRQIVEIFEDGIYQFTECKTKPSDEITLKNIVITTTDSTAAETGLAQGLAIAEGVTLAKHLADLPANICTPTFLAQQALTLAGTFDAIETTILDVADMEKLGMGSFLAVARGSREPAKLISLEYRGGDKNSKPIVLIGKGLTFDSGGISLKAGAGMDEMKYDMCGGAAVLGTLQAAAQLNLPLNIVGLIPSTENMPDGQANKPGDILTSMSGKTIEVLNTDAEGRLILCDTLTYAKRFQPEVVIDLATLTGAVLVALGRVPSGLLGNDDALCNDLITASETANDSVWRLPLWEEYQEQLKSNFADLANIGGKDAGTITAACFLANFAEDFRWAHLDIAG
ncbi:MAG: leucyl aminopeptidase, partial [Methylococcales bacterium]|nr:leucyl aminopeptidase [Methylococcales bacterium]